MDSCSAANSTNRSQHSKPFQEQHIIFLAIIFSLFLAILKSLWASQYKKLSSPLQGVFPPSLTRANLTYGSYKDSFSCHVFLFYVFLTNRFLRIKYSTYQMSLNYMVELYYWGQHPLVTKSCILDMITKPIHFFYSYGECEKVQLNG